MKALCSLRVPWKGTWNKPRASPKIFVRTFKVQKFVDPGEGVIPTSNPYLSPSIIPKKGVDAMNDPLYNKGVGFPFAERERLGIRGLMPPCYNTIEEQGGRVIRRFRNEPTDIDKYLMLNSLQDRNETLFYKLLTEYMEELAPIVYTPTVGKVAEAFGFLYRRPRGMYFSSLDKGVMASMAYNWPSKEVDVAVVTDGSRILGLGDLGANGMAIPVGKLALYVAAAGIHPNKVLPIMLDVGTNNEKLLNDPFYLGVKQKRVTGPEYYALVDEMLWALRNRWPNILVQFEDFSNENAHPILHKYRHSHLCFNDDIQGTGAVALSGIYSALRCQGKTPSALKEQRIVCVGAGSAGLGVVFSLLHGMVAQGLSREDGARKFWMLDKFGLVSASRNDLTEGQKGFARPDMEEGLPLLEVVKRVKPTILLGLSGVGGIFKEEVIREMHKHVDRPIIFPLSNPTHLAECTAQQAFEWTQGKALFASGSPFDPVQIGDKTCYPCQGNNMFIFPGIGLGVVACQARRVSTRMFAKAAEVLTSCMTEEDLAVGKVYPSIKNIRDVSFKIAVAVCEIAYQQHLATRSPPDGIGMEEWIKSQMYQPQYVPYVLNGQH